MCMIMCVYDIQSIPIYSYYILYSLYIIISVLHFMYMIIRLVNYQYTAYRYAVYIYNKYVVYDT